VNASPARRRYTLPARLRVRRAGSFQEAYRQGRKQVGRFVVLWLRSGEDAAGRVGTVASRRVGNSVARSRAKRRMREWFRLNQHRLRGQEDYILVARHAILRASQADLDADFERVFSRAGRLQSPEECPKSPLSSPFSTSEDSYE